MVCTKVTVLVLVVLQLFAENIQSQSVSQCGVPQISKAKLILHGYETVPGEWPWHAAVYHRVWPSESYACGGTLVSERLILTAAHCAIGGNGYKLSEKLIFVRLGVHNLEEWIRAAGQQLSVRKIHLHANYSNDDVQNDIAILELETMAKFNQYVQPACLGLTEDLTDRLGTAIGWGLTENEEVSPTLKCSRMPVVDYITCLKSDRAVFGETLSEMILCAGYINGTTVCNGDSGSGLFFQQDNKWYLGGIVSYTGHRSLADRRCNTHGYGAFTNLRMYLTWISSVIDGLQFKELAAMEQQQCELANSNFPSEGPNCTDNHGSGLVSLKVFASILNHLAVDGTTGMIYVGAVNKLYQLSSDLNITAAVATGPQNDSFECSILGCPKDIVRRPTDNWNKVLLIDQSTNSLIVCGSLFQGTCHIRSLQNVSIVEHEVPEAVVANTHDSSTVAFIGPGPPVPLETNVLYVGVTFTANSPYRSEIPAVSSRSLARDKLFQIASLAETAGTRIFVNMYARESYLINYVYGFSSGGFSYFLTTQYKSSSAHTAPKELITKMVRICQSDSNYYSYTEIPMDCISESTKFNIVKSAHVGKPGPDLAENLGITTEDDVLFTVFSQSNGSKNAYKSALCVYSLKAIRRKFMQNIKSCFSGVGQRGLDYIAINMPCIPTRLQTISEDFCGLDVNSPLGGENPIASIPVLLSELQMTSIAVTTTSNFTVVFIGTLTGQLKKVVVESSQAAQQYALMNVDVGSKIQPDMYLDTVKYDLYLMSKHKLFKIKVYDCSVYTTCGACLSAKDPFCGWCSLENKCSPKSECQDNFKDPLSWLSYKFDKCATITSVFPSQLQRMTAWTLELMIENLPKLKEPLVCAFRFANMETVITTNATKNRYGISCLTPRINLLPQIEHGKNLINAILAIKTFQEGPDIASTNFTFFDCSTFLTCTQCVSSQFPCDWCVEVHRCTHDTAENCRNDILVMGASRIGPSYRSGPRFCPTINVTDEGQEIMVASGTKKQVKVKVHIIGQLIVQTQFVCQFNIEGRVTSVNAQLLGDMIYCDEMEFAYGAKTPNLTATFAVIWGGSNPLDNPNNIRVVIYRCKELADRCSVCLALDDKYRCGWCSSSNTCEVEHQCGLFDIVGSQMTKNWLNSQQRCSNPAIHPLIRGRNRDRQV